MTGGVSYKSKFHPLNAERTSAELPLKGAPRVATNEPIQSVILSRKSLTFNELPIREESYYDQA